MIRSLAAGLAALLAIPSAGPVARAADVLPPASARFDRPDTEEVPDFQRHVLPLMGSLGCNGRACHGSFQGQGGFRLSLFGYDFKADHEALMAEGEGRVDVEAPELSLILEKPTLTQPHEGGNVLDYDTWEYNVLLRWIEGGAEPAAQEAQFDHLEVIPGEIVFKADGQATPLKVLAHWSDGTVEDVTCLTRFQTNDESIATVDKEGVVTSVGTGDTYIVAFYDNGVVGSQVIRPVSDRVGEDYPKLATPTEIDRHIAAKLEKLGIIPSEVCSDEEFLRRVSLDLTGSLPTPQEVRAFVSDDDPQKRAKKVDELLERPTYAAWWTNKLCDITGASPNNLRGMAASNEMARDWYDWMYRRIADNTPYDELIAGIVLGTSRGPGQDYDSYLEDMAALYRREDPHDFAERDSMPYFWARRNIRQPEEKALAFSYAFLGVRLECAQCHKHPFDQWTQDDFNQFTAFFQPIAYGINPAERDRVRELERQMGIAGKPGGEKRREIARRLRDGEVVPFEEVYIVESRMRPRRRGGSSSRSRGGRVFTPRVLGGDEVTLADYKDPREPLMQWLRSEENPYFAQAFVNRVWANYFGRGIIDPPDDMNLANPPSNPALLDYLTRGFVDHGFDMKWLHREITNSLAYQRSWRPNETNRLDERNFSRAVIRRLPAEVLLDAVAQATAGSESLAEFAVTADDRSFGPVKSMGGGRAGAYADRVFGRSARDTNCDCSRSDEPNLLQLIYLQNDQEVHAAIDRRDGWVREQAGRADDDSSDEGADLDRQIARAERALKGLRSRGPKAKAEAETMADRLADLRQRRDAARKAPGRKAVADSRGIEPLVEEAFLRTLGRLPDASERSSALAYFADSDGADEGLRGLLWALLNTKEFMTNH